MSVNKLLTSPVDELMGNPDGKSGREASLPSSEIVLKHGIISTSAIYDPYAVE